ncbi:MAG TPA: enoyl-CoA hydratase/isomerase family protein [Acidimicrobiales bacterium]|nr:enoyl-CoA hydratase/isomerase family protein [Acidimicrobiales bacterium]
MGSELRLERDGAVLIATIDREDKMNALGTQLHEDLEAAWASVKADSSIRAIVLTAVGERSFCTGMDLRELVARGEHRQSPENVHDALKITPLNCGVWLPTVVAVNGVCAAAGLHFVADADVVIGSTKAWFVDTHVSVGQVSAIEPITLIPRIGLGNALRLALLGRAGRVDVEEALRISLIDEIVDPGQLRSRAIELAQAMAAGSPAAAEASKRAIRGALERPMSDAMQYGWEVLRAHREHPDCTEGPRAFSEKRTPQWA